MRGIAAWLVARPQNAVLALGASMLLPVLQPFSSIVLVLLVLAQGARLALFQAALAGGTLLLVALLFGVPLIEVAVVIAATWLPVFLLALVLAITRSFTLTMQASAIMAASVGLGLSLMITDAVVFWQPLLAVWSDILQQNGASMSEVLSLNSEDFANQITVMLVLSGWMVYTLIFMLGYLLYGQLLEKSGVFGRIRDLNFGRVIASTLVLLLVMSFITGSVLLRNIAFILLAMFWMQAVALVHWLRTERRLPFAVVIAAYVLPLLSSYVAIAMTVLGYLDAWFGIRHLVKKA
jgi:hypothetical protein